MNLDLIKMGVGWSFIIREVQGVFWSSEKTLEEAREEGGVPLIVSLLCCVMLFVFQVFFEFSNGRQRFPPARRGVKKVWQHKKMGSVHFCILVCILFCFPSLLGFFASRSNLWFFVVLYREEGISIEIYYYSMSQGFYCLHSTHHEEWGKERGQG